MREKPAIPDHLLRTTLQDQYDFAPVTLEFLPVGLDYHAGVYRLVSEQGNIYLLKITSRPLYEPGYTIPRYLHDQGIKSVVAPLPATSGSLWAKLEHWTMIVYPFFDGDTSFTGMTTEQWRKLGNIFKHIHQVTIPADWHESIRKETFDTTQYTQWIHTFETQYLDLRYSESVSQQALQADWQTHQGTIHQMVNVLEKLAAVLQKQSGPYVFCHADLHPANLIRDTKGNMYVIDWDDVMLAPKERDFIFVRNVEADAFWEGYEHPHIDWVALTYYRCERVVQDVIACADDMFFKDDLGEETRADIVSLFHEIVQGDTSTINDIYTAAAHLPSDLIL
ncbi:MAG: phosphotransferase enzyme family protein [Ktedonobacteraceae bacterium]